MFDDKTAERFAEYMEKYPELYENLAGVVKRFVKNKNPAIVDLGVGPGLLSKAILKEIPNANIIGIDPNKKMLNLAKQNVSSDNFKTKNGSSENIPVDDDFADIVVSRFSLSYWKDQKKSFSEIYRVLKKDGHVILDVINKEFPAWRLFLIKIHMLLNKAGADVTKYHVDVYKDAYTIDEVEKFITSADLSVVERQGKKKEWKFLIIAKKN